jgi:hypothetical protein
MSHLNLNADSNLCRSLNKTANKSEFGKDCSLYIFSSKIVPPAELERIAPEGDKIIDSSAFISWWVFYYFLKSL